jgi:hypothetical protein
MSDDLGPFIIQALTDLGQIHMDYSRPTAKYDAFEVLRKRCQRIGKNISKPRLRDAVKVLEKDQTVKVGMNIDGLVYMIRLVEQKKQPVPNKPGPKVVKMPGSIDSSSKIGQLRAYLWWTIKEDFGGQINENHAGGNAGKVLRNAAEAHGAVFSNSPDLANAIAALIKMGAFQAVKESNFNRYKVIRMLKAPEMPCPFKIESQQQLAVVSPDEAPVKQLNAITVPTEGSLINGQRNWPISQRLQLIEELSKSVNEDLALVGNMFQPPAQ